MYLLDFDSRAQQDFLTWLHSGALTLIEAEPDDFLRVQELMTKYADLPMDFVDGLLVALCERLDVKMVASTDSDFSIYRFKGRGRFVNEFFA
jgi:predicted nucleic acid-binding protein